MKMALGRIPREHAWQVDYISTLLVTPGVHKFMLHRTDTCSQCLTQLLQCPAQMPKL